MTTKYGSHLGKPTKSYITPELWLDQLQILIIGTSIYWGYFTVSSQEVSTMALALICMMGQDKN
jgi:cytochrome c-type biogenesis protein CcmH/NrfF